MIDELEVVEKSFERVRESATVAHVAHQEYALIDHIDRAYEPQRWLDAKRIDEA